MYSIPGLLDCWAVRDYARFQRVCALALTVNGTERAVKRGHTASAPAPPAEVNRRDPLGRSVLHRVVASGEKGAQRYLDALLAHPSIDVNLQERESGWTPLHRALYAGNMRAAIALIAHPDIDLDVRDNEGLTPFALYSTTVHDATPSGAPTRDMFVWGANRNYSFGIGHCDDCALPERVRVRGLPQSAVPGARYGRTRVASVSMSRWHTVVLTDEHANVHVCGVGNAGRLGRMRSTQPSLERLRDLDDHVACAATAPDHTLLATDAGDVYSFGSNRMAALGYTIEEVQGVTSSTTGTLRAGARADPGCGVSAASAELDVQVTPRRVHGALKKEHVLGVAASRLHSAAFTADGLYTWGTNTGQLGYDRGTARVQVVPRRVAAITDRVVQLAAADHATACLLDNGDAVVLYGDTCHRLAPHLPSSLASPTPRPATITQVAAGGTLVAVLNSYGDVYTYNLPHLADRPRFPRAQLVWNARTEFVATAVAVGADGSVAVCLASGHVYTRVPRSGTRAARFTKVPFLSRAVSVATNGYEGFAALQVPDGVHVPPVARPSLEREIGGAAPDSEEFAQHAQWFVEEVARVRSGARATLSTWPGADVEIVAGGCAIPAHSALLGARGAALAGVLDVSMPAALLVLVYLYTDTAPVVWSAAAESQAAALARAERIDMPRLRSEALQLAEALGLASLAEVLRSTVPRFPTRTLRRDLAALFDRTVALHADRDAAQRTGADTVLCLADGFVPCHAFLLCRAGAFPPLFAWRRDAQERLPWVVDMGHVPWRTMRTALRYLYTDGGRDAVFAGTDTDETADGYIDYLLDVLVLADELLIDGLKDMCMALLSRRVKPSNLAAMIADADAYNAPALRDACIAYAVRSLESLLESRLLDGLDTGRVALLESAIRRAQDARMGHSRRLEELSELMVRHHDFLESLDIPKPSLGLACLKVQGKTKSPSLRPRQPRSAPPPEPLPPSDSSMIFAMDDEHSWQQVDKGKTPEPPRAPPMEATAPVFTPRARPSLSPSSLPRAGSSSLSPFTPTGRTPTSVPARRPTGELTSSPPTHAPPITPEAQAALKSMPVLARVSQKERKKQQRVVSEEQPRATWGADVRPIPQLSTSRQSKSWRPSSQEKVWRGSPSMRDMSPPLETGSPGPLSFAQIQQQQEAALVAAHAQRTQPQSFAQILEEERHEMERVREEQRAAEDFERWFEEESRRVQQQQRATRENRAREQRGRNKRQPRRKGAPARIDD